MSKKKKNGKKKFVPLATIEQAVVSDVDAINDVLKHFDGFMIRLSSKRGYDEDIHSRLRTKLISRLSSFNPNLQ